MYHTGNILEEGRQLIGIVDDTQTDAFKRIDTLLNFLVLVAISGFNDCQQEHLVIVLDLGLTAPSRTVVLRYLLLQDVKHLIDRRSLRQQINIKEKLRACRKFNSEEDWMLDLMTNVWSGEVVEQTFEVIANLYFVLVLTPVLPLDEVLIDVFHQKGLDERGVFFFLIISSRLS